MSGVTDNLIKLSKQVSPNPAEREMDFRLTGDTGDDEFIYFE